jgi:hypothetical protein
MSVHKDFDPNRFRQHGQVDPVAYAVYLEESVDPITLLISPRNRPGGRS